MKSQNGNVKLQEGRQNNESYWFIKGLQNLCIFQDVAVISYILNQVCENRMLCKIAKLIKCILRLLFVLANNAYCIPTYVIWMLTFFPLKRCSPDLYWRIEGHFFHWLLAMVSMWSWSAGYDVVEMGDDIRTCIDDRTLVIVNHQSTADVPLLMACFNTKTKVLPNLTWIMDKIFKYTNFGIVSILHEDYFISSGKEHRDASLQALVVHLKESYIPLGRKWMVLFPEGGFLWKRKDVSQKFAEKNNLPFLQHVSLPRVGAMQSILRALETKCNESILDHANDVEKITEASELKWILDITVAYPDGQPLDLADIVTGCRKPCTTVLFYRLYPSSEVPVENEALTTWLYNRFIEKEKILESYYNTGLFPLRDSAFSVLDSPKLVRQDPLRFLILHLFFIASTYVHFQLVSYLCTMFW